MRRIPVTNAGVASPTAVKADRTASKKRFRQIVASVAAGTAMSSAINTAQIASSEVAPMRCAIKVLTGNSL